MKEQRRLAAIVSVDVAGYSRLMGRDESGTVARLRRVRAEWLEPVLARRGGRIVKLTGDGALIEFASAVEALSAAIEFQQAMTENEAGRPESERLIFRVGVHLGDVIVDGDDLYGDGVNVAARLEAEAPVGGIVASGDMHNLAAGRVAATFEDLGRLSLKNIERPIQAYAVRWQVHDWPVASTDYSRPATAALAPPDTPLPLPDKPSIAVLPFQNMSGDPDQEYFADGMVGRHRVARRRRLLATDGPRRERHAGRAESAEARTRRSGDRAPSQPYRQDHGRRAAAGVRNRAD